MLFMPSIFSQFSGEDPHDMPIYQYPDYIDIYLFTFQAQQRFQPDLDNPELHEDCDSLLLVMVCM
jgi:hypothetical protein